MISVIKPELGIDFLGTIPLPGQRVEHFKGEIATININWLPLSEVIQVFLGS